MMRSLGFYVKKLAAGSLAMSLEKASQNLVGLILLPIFAMYLSPEDFGILAMFSLVITALGLIYNPGTLSSAVRLYFDTEDENRQKEIFAAAHTFFMLLPIPVTIVVILAGNTLFSKLFNDFNFMPFGLLAVILAFFSQPGRIWSEFMVVKYRVVPLAITTFVAFVLGAAVSLICIVGLEMGVMGRVIGMYVMPVALFAVSLITMQRYSHGMFRWKTMLEVVKFGLPLIGAIWAYSILQYTGAYLLERYMTMRDVGIYNIAYRLAGIPLFVTLGFRQMWTPIFYENMATRNYDVIRRLMTLFILFMTFISGFTILFAKEAILLLFDARYHEAIPIVGWIVLGVFLLGILPLSNSFLGYAKKFGLTSWIALASGIVNIILNIILIPKFGVRGAAWTLIISYAIYLGGGIIFTYREFAKVTSFSAILMTAALFVPAILITELTPAQQFSWAELLAKVVFLSAWTVALFKLKFLLWSEVTGMFRAVTSRLKNGKGV
jgi:O-antigen/teichoic acid export membrane protein